MTPTILSSLFMFSMIIPASLGTNIASEEQFSASHKFISHPPLVEKFQPQAKKGRNGNDDPIVPPNYS
ncbi:MAG: hypothetical protein WBV73_19975 [Phormidium sp.]